MRIPVTRIHALGLDWPADRTDADGTVDLAAVSQEIEHTLEPAHREYIAGLGTPDKNRLADRYFGLRKLGETASAIRRLVRVVGEGSLGVGPLPRSTITALGLPCGETLEKALVAAGDELDLVQTMLRLIGDHSYYQREYDGLSAQASKWGAPRDEVSDRWEELSTGIETTDRAIRELSAILAAVCK